MSFQPLIFEVLGGCDAEMASFFNGLYQEYDRDQYRKSGMSRHQFQMPVISLLKRPIGQVFVKNRWVLDQNQIRGGIVSYYLDMT